MNLGSAMRQKTAKQAELPLTGKGEAPTATNGNGGSGNDRLMERVVERNNAKAALKRVRQNKGSPGVDGMTVDELSKYVAENWIWIREQLLEGTYQPKPVREVEIPKDGGGIRKLGIPSALDRFIQQSILQVLQPMLDPTWAQTPVVTPGQRSCFLVGHVQPRWCRGRGSAASFLVPGDGRLFWRRSPHQRRRSPGSVPPTHSISTVIADILRG